MYKEIIGQKRAALSALFSKEKFSKKIYEYFLTSDAQEKIYLKSFLHSLDEETANLYLKILDTTATKKVQKYEKLALKKIKGEKVNVNAEEWFEHVTAKINLVQKIEKKVFKDIRTQVSKLNTQHIISLTQEEREWIKKHKTIRVGVENWNPIVFLNTFSEIDGLTGDFVKSIAKVTGLKMIYVSDGWDGLLDRFKAKEVDVLPATYFTQERTEIGLFSTPYFQMKDYIYVKSGINDIYSLKDLKGKKLAIEKGYGTIAKIQKKFPNIELVLTTGIDDSIHKVLQGKADAFYEAGISAEKKFVDDYIVGLKGFPIVSFKTSKLHFLSNIDEPILHSILQKSLDSITYKQKQKIIENWFIAPKSINIAETKKGKISFIGMLSLEIFLLIFALFTIISFIAYKNFTNTKVLNISIKTFIMIIVIFELSVISLMTYEIIVLDRTENILAKKHLDSSNMISTVDRLRQSSDDLTHFARSYAVTGNSKFEKQYLDTLKIRNGESARPISYNGIYWDLDSNTRMLKHPLGEKKSLRNIIKSLPFSAMEISKLDESEYNSNDLVNLEVEAFASIKQGRKEIAIKSLHSDEYYLAKQKIMLPIDELLNMIHDRTDGEIELLDSTIKNQFIYLLIIGLFFILGNILIYFLLRKKINEPIEYLTDVIRQFQDGTKDILEKEFHQDEIGAMNREFFSMKKSIDKKTFELSESQKRFSTLFDASPDSIAIIDDNGLYLDCNKATLDIFGLSSKKDFLKMRPSDFSPEFQYNDELSSSKAQKVISIAMKDGSHRFEWIHKRVDTQESFDTEVILTSLMIDDKQYIYAVVRDITDRKLLENTINQNNHHMTFVSQNANLGFWNFNPQVGDLFVNDIFVTMLGYDPKEVLKDGYAADMFKPFKDGLAFWEQLLHPDDVDRSTKVLMAHINGETDVYKVDYRMRRADGSWMWSTAIGKIAEYDEDGKPTRFNGVNLDIDDMKEAEQKIRLKEIQMRVLVDAIPSVIFMKDEKGKHLLVNKFYTEATGISNDIIIGKTDFDVMEQEIAKAITDKDKIVMESEQTLTYEETVPSKEGSIKHYLTSKVPWFNNESVGGIVGIATDITKSKELQKEIEEIHKHTRDSIEYASLIQGAVVSQHKDMQPFFKDSFVHWVPKDTVGGDIWLFNELRHKDECLLFFIDCTGHGVPGAFVTMIVKSIEREIIANLKKHPEFDISPAIIMGHFNKTMKELLKQENKDSLSNAGWDGGIIYYNKRDQVLKFAGAETPLFYIDENKELITIKGNRYSVGYKKCDADYEYKETIIDVKEGMKFYCVTDGYLDQNGGEKDFPFGKKRFTNIIKENHTQQMNNLKDIFINELDAYESMVQDNDRNDDITLLAFEIDTSSNFIEDSMEEIVKYEGIMTQNVIAAAIDNIEVKITNIGMLGNISTITIEYCQNMMHYSKNKEVGSREIVPEGKIEVAYINKEYYNISATNIVSIEDKEKIGQTLTEIKALDKAGIKKRYRELRKSGQNSHKKGGGIGMYEIAKISDSLEYNFKAINEDKYYFTMKSIVKLKEKKAEE